MWSHRPTLAHCCFTVERLQDTGGLVAPEEEVIQLDDLTKPYSSMDDIRTAAEAAIPTASRFKRRTLYTHKNALEEKYPVDQSRFGDLADDDEEDQDQEPPTNPTAQQQHNTINVTGGESQDPRQERALRDLKQDEKANTSKNVKHAATSGIKITRAGVANGNCEGTEDGETVGYCLGTGGQTVLKEFDDMEQRLRIREVNTSSTGNCMAMTIAQVGANHDLSAHDNILETTTASIKRGVTYAGQLDLEEQLDHYVRTTTLVNLHLGGINMSKGESKNQFKWYLEEYAGRALDRDSLIDVYNWGDARL
ncbi:hypothetical protein PHMEG_0005136 [Phytophthora megakarya]|uniref:Uncharacterized protein n=1 Tax=Phytophthora megakarya TaxID=4795 RepID=A0A225WS34_9STRA|nr:hypothetical protein PHMEG_0005136 [Phytophthora megakarya]